MLGYDGTPLTSITVTATDTNDYVINVDSRGRVQIVSA